jgi:hypothetical protein
MYKRISKSVAFRKPLWKEGLDIAQKNSSQGNPAILAEFFTVANNLVEEKSDFIEKIGINNSQWELYWVYYILAFNISRIFFI